MRDPGAWAPPLRPALGWAALVNAMAAASFLAAGSEAVPGPLRMLGAALAVLVLPGLAWLGLLRRRALDAPRLALALVGLSSASALGLLAAEALLPGAPSRALAVGWTLAVVNLGLLAAGRPGRLDPGTPWRALAAIAAAGFLATSLAALRLVPPLEDHDMEVRGTAYGLLTDLAPYFLTNRELYLAFSHPILFHVHVAESLLATGEIEAARPSYESARRAEAALARGEPVPWDAWWRADHEGFVRRPALAGMRAPSALFAALILALLADLTRRLTGSLGAGAGAAALYASFPETVVRSAYAGYFSVTVFAMLAAASLFGGEGPEEREGARPDRRLPWLAAAGAFAALVDHKTVVLVLGVALLALAWAARDILRRPAARSLRALPSLAEPRAVALGAGFALATLAWWAYGLAVDAPSFVRDHLRMHIAHRFLLNDVRLFHDANRYAPSILELWGEFWSHTGYLFLPVGLAGVLLWLARRQEGETAPVLAAWCLAGLVLYTLTDWRQTKHLMNELAPMTAAAVVLAWPRSAQGAPRRLGPWRAAALLALAAALAFNLAADARLLQDFRSLTVLGASDVDGW